MAKHILYDITNSFNKNKFQIGPDPESNPNDMIEKYIDIYDQNREEKNPMILLNKKDEETGEETTERAYFLIKEILYVLELQTYYIRFLGYPNDLSFGCGRYWENTAAIDPISVYDYDNPNDPSSRRKWIQISSYARTTLALDENGTLFGCGGNSYLGYPLNIDLPLEDFEYPAFTKMSDRIWKDVAFSENTTILLDDYGYLYTATASNSFDIDGSRSTPGHKIQKYGTDKWKKIFPIPRCEDAAESRGFFLINSDGSLWACGTNRYGHLGLSIPSSYDAYIPLTKINDSHKWIKVVSSGKHSFGITEDGLLFGTGQNGSGELGNGTNTSTTSFIQIGNQKWKDISAATISGGFDDPDGYIYHGFSIGLQENGILFTTGWNNNGQLGLGDYIYRNTFTQVETVEQRWKAVCAIDKYEPVLYPGSGINTAQGNVVCYAISEGGLLYYSGLTYSSYIQNPTVSGTTIFTKVANNVGTYLGFYQNNKDFVSLISETP